MVRCKEPKAQSKVRTQNAKLKKVVKLKASSVPLGIRLNNPGNLRSNQYTKNWLGYVREESGFCVFDIPEHGIFAIVKQLRIDKYSHSLNTIRGVITRWAPPNENLTEAYILAVAKRMVLGGDELIDLASPKVLRPFVKAIIWQENGQQPYPETMFDKVIY